MAATGRTIGRIDWLPSTNFTCRPDHTSRLLKNSYSRIFSTLEITVHDKVVEIVSLEAWMRGTQDRQASMLALISIEGRIPSEHPLRGIKGMADRELLGLSRVFNQMYSKVGRPSV